MKKINKHLRNILLGLAAVIMLIFANVVYYVFQGQSKSLEKLDQGKELNAYECFSIYTMHCAMWMSGPLIMPTGQWEAMLMHFPHDEPVAALFPIDVYAHNGYSLEVGPDMKAFYIYELTTVFNSWVDMEVSESASSCALMIEYTDRVIKRGKITINTRLFKYLQNKGLLFPYGKIYFYIY